MFAFFQVQLPNGVVKHDHYMKLLEHEEHLPAGLRTVPKITYSHVAPNAFQKMNVRLCTQVCSLLYMALISEL